MQALHSITMRRIRLADVFVSYSKFRLRSLERDTEEGRADWPIPCITAGLSEFHE